MYLTPCVCLFPAVPERPEDLEVKAVTKDSVSLAWNPPKYNGGSDITMYVLESRLIGKEKFSRITKEKMLDRKYTVEGLKDGDTYEYRVSACNVVGQGKPSFCTKPITCKDEIGTFPSCKQQQTNQSEFLLPFSNRDH